MKKFHLAMLMLIPVSLSAFAEDQKIEEITDTFINIRKVSENSDHYKFEVCNIGKCNTLGSANGYTADEIKSLQGRWQQIGAIAGGAVAAPLVAFSGGWGGALGLSAEALSAYGIASTDTLVILGLGTGTIAGVAAPIMAVKAFDSLDMINPVSHYKDGKTKAQMKNKMIEMLKNGKASIVLTQDTDAKNVKVTAQRIEIVLKQVEFFRDHPVPANINEDPSLGSSAFSGI